MARVWLASQRARSLRAEPSCEPKFFEPISSRATFEPKIFEPAPSRAFPSFFSLILTSRAGPSRAWLGLTPNLRTLWHPFTPLFDFIYPQKSGYKLFNHTLFDKVDVLNCLKISLVLLHASGSPRSSQSKPKGISCHCSKVIGTI